MDTLFPAAVAGGNVETSQQVGDTASLNFILESSF